MPTTFSSATPATLKTSTLPVLAGVLLVGLFGHLFLHAESQLAVLALSVGGIALLWACARFGWTARSGASAAAHPQLLGGAVVAVVVAVGAVSFDSHFALLMLTTVLLYSTVCLGLNIQFGYCGVVNFSGAAFFGIGSYSAAVLVSHTPLPHLLVIALGGVIAALIGSLLLLPVLRTRGHYAALVTIAFGILFKTFLEVNDTLGGPQGLRIPGMQIFGWQFNDNIAIGDYELSFYLNYLLLALALCTATFVMVRRLERSWIGLSMDVVRLDETAASTFGVDIRHWKITAFTFGNLLTGMAGAVYGMMTGYVAPNNFTFGDSLILVSIVVLGGIGNPWGILPAAAIVLILPEKLQFIQEYRFLLYAVLVILILLFRPEGLLPRRLRAYFPGEAR
jgi:ABC-type branched-subunit amino acid transport system permease subunit